MTVVALAACAVDRPLPPAPPDPPNVVATYDRDSGRRLDIGPVVRAATAPPSVSGGTLATGNVAGRRVAVAADPDRDRVVIVDLDSRKVMSTVLLAPNDEPGRVALDDAGRAHVVLRRSGAVVAIDIASGAVLSRRAVCSAPRGLAFDGRHDSVHVACFGGELVSLPTAGGPATRKLKLEGDLRDVVADGDRLLVSRFRTAELTILHEDGTLVTRFTLPPQQAPSPTGGTTTSRCTPAPPMTSSTT